LEELTMTEQTAIVIPSGVDRVMTEGLELAVKGKAANTRRAYRQRVTRFLRWVAGRDDPLPVLLVDYLDAMIAGGLAPRSVQTHLSTIKTCVRKAAILYPQLAAGLPQLELAEAPKVRGDTIGNRLSEQERDALLSAPDTSTVKGVRDVAILGLLSECGLRRSEVANLDWRHFAEVDGHRVIRDLAGKHGRNRTIPLTAGVLRAIQAWADRTGLDTSPDAPVFVSFTGNGKGRKPSGERLSAAGVAHVARYYAGKIGHSEIAPHDLRRTAAALARKAGASIEQVQALLGHASPQTTSRYIGETLNLDDHALLKSKARYPVLEAAA
jgi:integrase/recombinase XerD